MSDDSPFGGFPFKLWFATAIVGLIAFSLDSSVGFMRLFFVLCFVVLLLVSSMLSYAAYKRFVSEY